VRTRRTISCWAFPSPIDARANVPLLAAGLFFSLPSEAWAHRAPMDRPVGWRDWNGDPVVWLSLALMGWLYLRGLQVMAKRTPRQPLISRYRQRAFFLGWATLGLALLTPLDPLSDQLAWAHMVQHMILMTVSAPLIVMGAPQWVCLWGLSMPARRLYGRLRRWGAQMLGFRLLWNPLLAWGLFAATMWLWHLPSWYEAALRSASIHDLQHLSFFLVSCLFWRLLLDPFSRFRLGSAVGVLYLFTTTIHATVLGVFMTLAPQPWYPAYVGRTDLWGLTPLEDQQLAGLIMWMPGCLAYALVAIGILVTAIEAQGKVSGLSARRDGNRGAGLVPSSASNGSRTRQHPTKLQQSPSSTNKNENTNENTNENKYKTETETQIKNLPPTTLHPTTVAQ
jgi:putative membrane protein